MGPVGGTQLEWTQIGVDPIEMVVELVGRIDVSSITMTVAASGLVLQ